jgi:hypothetical protein
MSEPPDGFISVNDLAQWLGFWGQGSDPMVPPVPPTVPALPGWAPAALFGLLAALGLRPRIRRACQGRRRRVGTLALLALAGVLAGRPALAQEVILEWAGTGTDTYQATGGEQITLEIYVSGFSANAIGMVSVSLGFDADLADELDLVSASENPTLVAFSALFTPVTTGPLQTTESTSTEAGGVFTLELFTTAVGPLPGDGGKYLIAQVVFDVNPGVKTDGVDVTVGFYNAGVDGIIDSINADISGSVTFGTARVDKQP